MTSLEQRAAFLRGTGPGMLAEHSSYKTYDYSSPFPAGWVRVPAPIVLEKQMFR